MSQDIQWFPGHMAKTIKELKVKLQGVDCVIECIDSRIPYSSRNPIIDTLLLSKHKHIIVLTKIDLADSTLTEKWKSYFLNKGKQVVLCNIPKRKGLTNLITTCKQLSANKRKNKRFAITRAMIVGIPNVGKSALINALSKKQAAKVQNKPGLTRQTKGIMIDDFIELIDTPGLLWPKIEDLLIGKKLAITCAIKQTLVDDAILSDWLIDYLSLFYPKFLKKRYKLEDLGKTPAHTIELIARQMKWISSHNEPDEQKTHRKILSDYQLNKLGNLTLDQLSDSDR